MKALLIDVDFKTGQRPAAIGNPGENLWCGHRWQNLDTGKEVRAVKNDNTTPYEGKEGITILHTEREIRTALTEHFPDEVVHIISNESILNASIASIKIDWGKLPQEATKEEELAFLYDKGVRGIDRKTMSPQDPLEILPA